ncbi:alginate lyase family protein [Pseudodesulfovibrio sp.]|nr:alginate lyase family protein [Pseudodesulfovibrio sp.]
MVVRALFLTTLFLLLAGHAQAKKLPETILFSPEVLAETKRRVQERDPAVMPAYKKLIEQADRALKAPAETVIFKPKPGPSGDIHDYWSLSPYWWPNPKSPGGLPYIRRDGMRNPTVDSDTYDRARMRRMSTDALTLALAWYLTDNEEYSGKGTALIWTWCCDSITRTNPNMNYAQSRLGLTHGHRTGIIETRDMIKVVEAARIMEPSKAWSKAVTRKVTAWFAEYVAWLQTSDFGKKEAAATNNHGTWYDVQLAVFSLYIGDTKLVRAIIDTLGPRRLIEQIRPNGAMPAELDRSRSRHYTFFTLEAYFILAAVGERVGLDFWHWESPTNVSIKKAFDYAAPYLAEGEPWPFGDVGKYDPFMFTPLFHRAAMVYKEPRYLEILQALPKDALQRDRAQLFY